MLSGSAMKSNKDYRWYNVNWFRRMALVYDYVEFLLGDLRKKVANKINDSNLRILDVACGTGNQSIAFARRGFSVVGIDMSPDMLKYAKKKKKPFYKIKFICKDATEIPYQDSSFDVSSISFGLHDMPEEIAIKILKEMIRTTKKNGEIIIVDYYTPRKGFSSLLGHKIVKTWETKNYDHFRKVGLGHYLNQVNLKQFSKESHLIGNMQIVVCQNIK